MFERLRVALSRTSVDPNHSTDEEVYVPYGVGEHYDPDYVNGPDEPEDFDEVGDIPDSEVEGK